MDKKGTITELWKTAGGTRWKVGLLFFTRAAIAFINVAVALLLRDLINAAVAQQKELFFSKAVFFIGLICGRVAAGAANRFLQERISAELENKWKTRLFDALLRQDYGYVSAVHSGEWMTRLTNDTVVVAGGMTNLLPDLGGIQKQGHSKDHAARRRTGSVVCLSGGEGDLAPTAERGHSDTAVPGTG